MIRSIIIEDEVMARKSLEKLCNKLSNIDLCGIYEDAESALDAFKDPSIDLLLLDIEMPGMSGLELMEAIPYLPQVVFTTGNKDYAYEAFEYDVTDFLKKPINFDRFQKAIEKVDKQKQKRNAVSLASSEHEFYIKAEGKLVRLPYDTILYFENVGDYIKVITTEGNHIIHGSLKSIDQKITNPRFIKTHRSYIVNMNKIKDIENNSLVIEKKVIPISRAHKQILLNSLNLL